MEAPLSGTPEVGWRASGPVGWLSETCEAGWRASSLVGSGYGGYGSASNSMPGAVHLFGGGAEATSCSHVILSTTLAS